MSKLLLPAAALAGLAACQTSHLPYSAGIYRSAAAFRQQRLNLNGTQVKPAFTGHHLLVVQAKSGAIKRVKVAPDSIWGYVTARGQAYRTFQRQAYSIRQVDTLTIYSRHVGKNTHFYFSQGLTGPIVVLAPKRLRETFGSNPTFMSLLGQFKWYQRLEAPEPTAGSTQPRGTSYRVVALYRQSLGLPITPFH
ncbi:MAG: hypothetical protein ACRYFK_08890 [Janthinobacterium lividum]